VPLPSARRGRRLYSGGTLPKLEDAAKKIAVEAGTTALAFAVDVTSEESINDLQRQVVDSRGTIDILVNAHGINMKVPALDIASAGWDTLFATNVRGTALMCKAFGKIINLSSVRGIRGTDGGNTLCGASNGAVDMITRMLAAEWAIYNVNVNAIAPSLIMTETIRKNVAPERLEMFLARSPLKRFAVPARTLRLPVSIWPRLNRTS
jgi:NAD(P)-dependent dehydrogenase (short-subunit alcohol dehydrogenase family)